MANISVSRKSGFIRRQGVMRRESLWFGIAETTNTITAGNNAILFAGLGAAELALRPFTVVRTRGEFLVVSDQKAAGIENVGAGLGVAVVSDQALAIGVTAVPTPMTDRGSDLWFLFIEIMSVINTGATAVETHQAFSRSFDSKAMRKVEEGQDLAFSIETSAISSGAIIQKAGRMLVKLH